MKKKHSAIIILFCVICAALSLSSHGVSTIGAVPGGLPPITWPGIPAGDYARLAVPAKSAAANVFVCMISPLMLPSGQIGDREGPDPSQCVARTPRSQPYHHDKHDVVNRD